MLFCSNYDQFKFLHVGASTLECVYDCLLDIMLLFGRNKLILIPGIGRFIMSGIKSNPRYISGIFCTVRSTNHNEVF